MLVADWLKLALWLCWTASASSSKVVQDSEAPEVVHLDSRRFREYAGREANDFALVLLVSADTERCEYCRLASGLYSTGVAKLKNQKEENKRKPLQDSLGRSVVFAEVDVLRNNEVGRMLGLDEIPHLYIFDANNISCKKQKTLCNYSASDILVKNPNLEEAEVFKPVLTELGLEQLWIQHFQREPWITRQRVVLVATTLLLAALPFFQQIVALLNKHMWVVGITATCIYALATSGIIYNWQHGMWYLWGQGQHRERQFVNPNIRSQYLGEGLMFSFGGVLVSTAFYAVALLVADKRKRPVTSILAVIIFVAALTLCLMGLRQVMRKVPYMKSSLLPPDESYVMGGHRRDRRYST